MSALRDHESKLRAARRGGRSTSAPVALPVKVEPVVISSPSQERVVDGVKLKSSAPAEVLEAAIANAKKKAAEKAAAK